MASRLILRRMGRCRLLEHALLAFRDKVSVALEERFRPFLREGETMPAFRMVLSLFARSMNDYSEKLSFADISRLDELDGDAEVREQLTQATENIRQILINSRETVRYVYGKGALKRFGFQRRTGRTPLALLEQGRRVARHFRDPEKLVGLEARVQVAFDFLAEAAKLEAALAAVEGSSDQIELERRKAIETKIQKDSTMGAFDDTFIPQARIIEGLFHVAGFRKLASRIRPATTSRINHDDVDTEGLEELEQALEESLAEMAAEEAASAGNSPLEPPTPVEPPPLDQVDDPQPTLSPDVG